MADITISISNNAETTPKKVSGLKSKDKKIKATHPTTAIMVNNAIQNLKERGGSSLQAIKKYITATYKIDSEKLAPFIKKYLKNSVINGTLVQTKGKGASGSFKLASTAVTKKKNDVNKKSTKVQSTIKSTDVTIKKSPNSKLKKTKKTSKKEGNKKITTTTIESKTPKKINAMKKEKVVSNIKKSPIKSKKITNKPKSPKPKTTKPKMTKKNVTSPKKK